MKASVSYVEKTLKEQGLTPNKNLGQNFYTNGQRLGELVASMPLQGKTVLEIGPGLGSLTELLLLQAERVIAVEKDRRLGELLQKELPDKKLTVLIEDCLATDYGFLPADFAAVGNLPYCLTTPISELLLCLQPGYLALMLQKEAAERFFASPSHKNYGPLSMVAQLYYRGKLLAELPKEDYFPAPTVDSALIALTKRPDAPREDPRALLQFFALCLRMRRKTLKNNLSSLPGGPEALEETGLSGSIRGEALEPERLLNLYQTVNRIRKDIKNG